MNLSKEKRERLLNYLEKLKENKEEYYQISYLLETEDTRKREFGVYEKVSDNYPKYVLSMDKIDFSQNGIIHLNIIDFLLNDKIDKQKY